MEQLLETNESKTRMSHVLVKNWNLKVKVFCKQHQNATLMNKVFIFSAILLHLTKYFCKLEIFLNMLFMNTLLPTWRFNQ